MKTPKPDAPDTAPLSKEVHPVKGHGFLGHSMMFWGVIALVIALIVVGVCLTLFFVQQAAEINGKIIRIDRCDNKNYSIELLTIDVYDKHDTKITLATTQIKATPEYYQIDLGADTAIKKIVINNLPLNPASILGCQIAVNDAAGKVVLLNKFSKNAIMPMDRDTAIAIYEAKNSAAVAATTASSSADAATSGPLYAAKAAAVKAKMDARLSVMSVTATWMKGVAKKLPAATQAAATQGATLWDTAATKGAAYVALPAHATNAQQTEAMAAWDTAETAAISTMAYAEALAADALKAKGAADKAYLAAQSEKAAAAINTPELTFATTKEVKAKDAKEAWDNAVTLADKAVTDKLAATTTTTEALTTAATASRNAAYTAAKDAYALTMLVPGAAKPTFTLTATRNIFTTTYAYHLA